MFFVNNTNCVCHSNVFEIVSIVQIIVSVYKENMTSRDKFCTEVRQHTTYSTIRQI